MSSKVLKLMAVCLLLLSLGSLTGCLVAFPHGGHGGPHHGYRPAPWGGNYGGHHGPWR
ncbi:MAG: hypothetical protein V1806_07910 [Pseudomonadota bacterium]